MRLTTEQLLRRTGGNANLSKAGCQLCKWSNHICSLKEHARAPEDDNSSKVIVVVLTSQVKMVLLSNRAEEHDGLELVEKLHEEPIGVSPPHCSG